MNPHRPRKPASNEYTTDEEEMIVYDVEDEIETNPDYVKKNAKIGSCANNPNIYSLTHSPKDGEYRSIRMQSHGVGFVGMRMIGQRFSNEGEDILTVNDYFVDQDSSHYKKVMELIQHRWEKYIELKGDYVEE
ncbi:hypothetical protein TNCV_2798891 [Trichonephila clavipes]|nr:hypothetical protein TNCV_2798891 [Trichonephila clavipes]